MGSVGEGRKKREVPARVLVPNYGIRHSGVTSVIQATLPHLKAAVETELVGLAAGPRRADRSALNVLFTCFRPPEGVPFRIWHARRNVELLLAMFMRSVLRQPLRIVFSAARQRPFSPLSHWMIEHADALIATSPEAQSFLHGPSALIPHGVDCDIYRPAADRDAKWRTLGFGGRYGIGIFGRVRGQKGTDRFVAAMIELLPRHPDFTAIVCGLAKYSEASFLAKLKQQVREAGLSERIHFLGERPAEEVPHLLAAVSICVSPQPYEGFGLVPLEAAACGTPVVATRVGAAPDIVADSETGLLVDREDDVGLTAAIDRLMSEGALRADLGSAARRRAVERFSIAGEVEAYLGVYRALWLAAAAEAAQVFLSAPGGRSPPTECYAARASARRAERRGEVGE